MSQNMQQNTQPQTVTLGPNDILIRVQPDPDVDMNEVMGEITSALEYSNLSFHMVTAQTLATTDATGADEPANEKSAPAP